MRKAFVALVLLVLAVGVIALYQHTHREWVLLRSAETSVHRGDVTQAQSQYRELLARENSPPHLLRKVGDGLAAVGDLDGATVAFEQLAGAQEAEPRLARHLAGLYARQQRFAQAAQWYRRSLEWEPRDRSTRIYLARTLTALGEFEQAIIEYRRALKETDS